MPLFLAANAPPPRRSASSPGSTPPSGDSAHLDAQWSDRVGRKPLIVAVILLQAAALGLLAGSDGAVGLAAAAAVLLGAGTALVYPTPIAGLAADAIGYGGAIATVAALTLPPESGSRSTCPSAGSYRSARGPDARTHRPSLSSNAPSGSPSRL